MTRKKKSHAARKKSIKNQETLFNPALREIPSPIKNPPGKEEKSAPPRNRPKDVLPDDTHYFLEAMSGVAPLPGKRKAFRIPDERIQPAHPPPDDVKDTLNHLNALVDGVAEMDITYSDEYIEGSVKGFSRNLMKRLKKGHFPIQDYIDLHGLTRQEAEEKVRDFLLKSQRFGLRCVLIVHGRGLNSPDSFPVLKENLPVWLGRGPARKTVLAFATARPFDGGTGAVYVLLRKA